MKKVAVVGIGHGKFGVRSDASLRELAFEAVRACLDDANISLKEVDSMVTGIGHPIGATGVSMAIEITKQLRREAGERQVKDPEIGLAHNVGGTGQVVAVHIFRRE